MNDPPVTRELLRAALNAIHEAFGTPVTCCKYVNRAIREYPDIDDGTIALLLADHDAGRCDCAERVPM